MRRLRFFKAPLLGVILAMVFVFGTNSTILAGTSPEGPPKYMCPMPDIVIKGTFMAVSTDVETEDPCERCADGGPCAQCPPPEAECPACDLCAGGLNPCLLCPPDTDAGFTAVFVGTLYDQTQQGKTVSLPVVLGPTSRTAPAFFDTTKDGFLYYPVGVAPAGLISTQGGEPLYVTKVKFFKKTEMTYALIVQEVGIEAEITLTPYQQDSNWPNCP